MQKIVLIAALTIGLLMVPFLVYAEVYKWVDEKGTVNFTDDYSTIPEKYGQQVERSSLLEASKPMTEGEKTGSKAVGIPLPSSAVRDIPLFFSGMISTLGSGTIAVTGEGKDMVFLVSEDTSIKTDYGQRVSFSELKNGRPVTVEYIKKGDDNHAQSIKVSLLEAGATNANVDNQGGPGKMQNPGETQKSVWGSQKGHKLPQGHK